MAITEQISRSFESPSRGRLGLPGLSMMALMPLIRACHDSIAQSTVEQVKSEESSCFEVSDAMSPKNLEHLEQARERFLKFNSEFEPLLTQHETRLEQEIQAAFQEQKEIHEIAEVSGYDFLYRKHLPTQYEGKQWNELPTKIQNFLKYLRLFAAQKIYSYAHSCQHPYQQLAAGHIMGVQKTSYTPDEALESAYHLHPFNKSGYVPDGKKQMAEGKPAAFSNDYLIVDGRYHRVLEFSVMVGAGYLTVDKESFEGLRLKHLGFVSGPEGLYALAQPEDGFWCDNNLIVIKVYGGENSSEGLGQNGPAQNGEGGGGGLRSAEESMLNGQSIASRALQNGPAPEADLKTKTHENAKKSSEGYARIEQGNGGKNGAARKGNKDGMNGRVKSSVEKGQVIGKPSPTRRTQSSGGYCNPEDWTREGDPFDLLREASGEANGKWNLFMLPALSTESRQELCDWLDDEEHFDFVVRLTGEIPKETPLFYAWGGHETCENNWHVENKGAHCVVLSNDAAHIGWSLDRSYKRLGKDKRIRVWDLRTGESLVVF